MCDIGIPKGVFDVKLSRNVAPEDDRPNQPAFITITTIILTNAPRNRSTPTKESSLGKILKNVRRCISRHTAKPPIPKKKSPV
jgi:hypothetical protein